MSTVKVNTVDKRTGSTLTLGGCGTTVTLGAGATQSGFGRTGTVDWCTTAKTSPFTGVSGKGYFVNTTCGAVTVTLPASPSAGDIISIADYTNTWQTNAVTICRNSSKIGGICSNANLSTQGQSITLVYVDATEGWKNVQDSTSNVTGNAYITATGGTITTCGDYKIHTFTADGCFSVSSAPTPANAVVSYVVVAGGGGGAGNPGAVDGSAGAGAGGYREGKVSTDPYTASPLALTPCSALPVTSTTYPITVGAGGSPGPSSSNGSNGSNSIFSTIISTGGGGGNYPNSTSPTTGAGGSGSGAAASPTPGTFAAGNTPPVSPPQGNPGGNYTSSGASAAGGGGGAGAVGGSAPSNVVAGSGGAGVSSSITGSSVTRGGGGGGSSYPVGTGGDGGLGGGGAGGISPTNPTPVGISGTTNTGGGGGAANANPGNPGTGGAGGSGIVIIRYKYQ